MNTPNDPKGAAGALKTPLALIPPHAMEQTALVHKLGAEKYGRRVPVLACSKGEELEEFCTCECSTQNPYATQIDPTHQGASASSATRNNTQAQRKPPAIKAEFLGPKDFVNPATISIFEKLTRRINRGSKKQPTSGSKPIKSMSKKSRPSGTKTRMSENETLSLTDKELFYLSGLLSKMKLGYSKNKTTDAPCAEDQQVGKDSSTSTTTIQQGSSEGSYATDATKDLACSETISKLFKMHSPTCSVQSLIIRDGEIEQYGAYNWRRTGVCATTYIAAIMRHLNAWRDGEDLDPESGISHIAHVACGCNILLDAAYCGTLQDDRYRIPVKDAVGDVVEDEFVVDADEPKAMWNLNASTGRFERVREDKYNLCDCGRELELNHTCGFLCPECDY